MTDDLLITQSTIKEYTRCRRRWWLATYRRLRKAEYRSPLTVGNLVHDALAAYYDSMYGNSNGVIEPIQFVKARSLAVMEEFPEDAQYIAKDAEMAGIMVEGYMEWLEETAADAQFEEVEPEREIAVQLTDGVILLGKLDGKVLTRDGWTGFLEHKTVGNFTELPAVAQIERQYLTYDLLEYLELLQLGESVAPGQPLTDGAILNMLRKVKRTSRANPPFYARHKVEHNIEELRSHWKHVVAIAKEMQDAITRLDAGESHHTVAPPTPTLDCRWSCNFFSVCPLFDDGSDVEVVLDFEYEEHDPLERYETRDAV